MDRSFKEVTIMSRSIRLQRGVRLAVIGTALLIACQPHEARANEARGDLNLELRLVQTVPGGGAGAAMTGLARIEVSVDAVESTHGVALSVERPDGRAWPFKGRALALSGLDWTGPDGERVAFGGAGPTVPHRGVLRTTIEVPLAGAAMHEIVVRATGIIGDRAVGAENVLRVPLGVAPDFAVDDGSYANFAVKGVQ
jgi:hypothetical protein